MLTEPAADDLAIESPRVLISYAHEVTITGQTFAPAIVESGATMFLCEISPGLREWSDELRSIADEGLLFDPDHPYHPPRYRRVRRLAAEMFAAQSGEDDDTVEAFFTTDSLHITPYVGADAAIFDDEGRILLVQRRDTSLWAMPGGVIEVGETPAEAASRETHEETALVVEPLALLGVYDSRRCGTLAPVHLYHIVFACRLTNDAPPQVSVETLAVDWLPKARCRRCTQGTKCESPTHSPGDTAKPTPRSSTADV